VSDAEFVKCHKPDCLRKVKPGVLYCCPQCSSADEYGYELAGPDSHSLIRHSDACDQRSAERGGGWTWAEAQAHLAKPAT
jgi:hypothetical protein